MKYRELSTAEEAFFKQKSRISWIDFGDQKTGAY